MTSVENRLQRPVMMAALARFGEHGRTRAWLVCLIPEIERRPTRDSSAEGKRFPVFTLRDSDRRRGGRVKRETGNCITRKQRHAICGFDHASSVHVTSAGFRLRRLDNLAAFATPAANSSANPHRDILSREAWNTPARRLARITGGTTVVITCQSGNVVSRPGD